MTSPFATAFMLVLAIVLINVYRTHGAYGVRAWFAAKFLNKQMDRPRQVSRRTTRIAHTRTATELSWKEPVAR